MSRDEKTDAIIYRWWREEIAADAGAARALAAQLRRASGPLEILAHKAVFELGDKLNIMNPKRLTLIAGTLAHVREQHHSGTRLARLLGAGSDRAVMSKLRFQKLLRSTDSELPANMRRALAMVDGKCNVGALGKDLLFWNDKTRERWCYDYFGKETS